MNFLSQFLCDFTHGPERASFLEHLFCVLWLGLTIGGLLVILLTVAVWLACHLQMIDSKTYQHMKCDIKKNQINTTNDR